MQYQLYVNPEKCIGCRTCEIGCSFSHQRDNKGLAKSRINISILQNKPVNNYPIICLQCDQAACALVCPTEAIVWNEETGALEVTDACIKCGACVAACPFGNMLYDANYNEYVKCDLCGGQPVCAMFCPTKALEYKPVQERVSIR